MDILVSSWFLPTLLLLTFSIVFMRRNTSNPKLPPCPPKLPIIGNFHQVAGKDIHLTLSNLSRKYGPIFRLHFGAQPFVVVSSTEIATQVLKTHDQETCTRPLGKATKRLSFNYMDVAFSPHGDHWRDMRKVLVSEFLGAKRARSLRNVLEVEMEGLFRSLSSSSSTSTAVTLDDLFLNLVNDSVCKVTFGKSYRGKMFNGKTVKEIVDGTVVMLGGSLSDVFPSFGWIADELTGWNRRLDRCFSDIDGFLQMILDEHKATKTSEHDNDLVDDLMSRLTEDEVKAILLNVLNGAIDTTASALVWGMSEIVKNPRIMEKLQNEIRSCVGSGKPRVEESDIGKMRYLKMVVKETLRVHPPIPLLLTRVCTSRCKIGGYDVLPRTKILINTWGIGRDPSIWTESATEFIPERFEDVEIDFGGKHFEMVPFGGGRRACPGYNSATWTIEFVLANLLYSFDWELPGGLKNEDLDMEDASSVPIRRKTPLCLVPKKHHIYS